MSFNYIVFNTVLSLPFPCPVLPIALPDATPDVIFNEGIVPRTLENPIVVDSYWQISANRFLFRANRNVGRFLIENGCRVTIERARNATDEMLCVPIMGTVLAALLHQRSYFVLHANTAITPSGTVAISGESGAGKTTTLAALIDHGCSMLSDDLTVLKMSTDGMIHVMCGIPNIHLCEDTAHILGHDISSLERYPWRRMKAAIPCQSAMANDSSPLHSLYLLEIHEGSEVIVSEIAGAAKISAIQACMFGPVMPQEQVHIFHLMASITKQVSMYRISRPQNGWSVNDIVRKILNG
jgi:hypothetical protein